MSKKIYLFSLVLLTLAFVLVVKRKKWVNMTIGVRGTRHILTLWRMSMLRLLVEEAWNA